MNDQKLIEAFLEGRKWGFDQLMARYQQEVFFMVRAMVFDREEAKDITQEAFIKAFKRLRTLKEPARFGPWIKTIAARTALDHMKGSRGRRVEEKAGRQTDTQTPERQLRAKRLALALKKAISQLPPRQAQVVGLKLLRQLEPSEIARIAGMNPATVRTNLFFGLKRVKKELAKQGYGYEI